MCALSNYFLLFIFNLHTEGLCLAVGALFGPTPGQTLPCSPLPSSCLPLCFVLCCKIFYLFILPFFAALFAPPPDNLLISEEQWQVVLTPEIK